MQESCSSVLITPAAPPTTATRSGVMDSLLRASLLRFSPLIPGVNYPMTYVGTRSTAFCSRPLIGDSSTRLLGGETAANRR